MHRAREVIALRVDRIGDLLVTTPALRNLRSAIPGARITLVTSPLGAGVLAGWDAIDTIEVLDPADRGAVRANLLGRLRRLRPDVIFAFTPRSSVYLLAKRIGAPLRVGFGYQARPLDVAAARCLLTHPVFSRVPEAVGRAREVPHHADELLALLRAVGLPGEPCPMEAPIAPSERTWADALLAGSGIVVPPIVVHLSDKWLDEGWEPGDVVALLDALACVPGGRRVVATVGPADARIRRALQPALDARQNGPLVLEHLTFGRWAALIAASGLVVSPDTGAIHLASATGRPVVGVYAAHRFHVLSRQWAPWMVPHRALRKRHAPEGVDQIAQAASSLLEETAQARQMSGGASRLRAGTRD